MTNPTEKQLAALTHFDVQKHSTKKRCLSFLNYMAAERDINPNDFTAVRHPDFKSRWIVKLK